ncbi:MAG TPA: hypothetical protein PLI42_00750 [Candidatus Pacearchaeota archaeon]|nr:hypothetical protein [Candidatus Pacearchaeota archaeon]HOS12512.1 hypothetical protein [Candidatus Pacearchaeota archaeon]
MSKLNEQEISEEELKKIKEELANDKSKKLVEIAPGSYKILSKLDE